MNPTQNESQRSFLRTIVRGTYDLQKLRIQIGNRVIGNFKAKLGQKPSETEETLDKESQDLLNEIRLTFKLATDGVIKEIEKNEDEDKPDKEDGNVAKKILELVDIQYLKMVEKGFPSKKKFAGNPVISHYVELCLIDEYKNLQKSEETHFRRLENVLEEFPIFNEFLVKVKGCGPAMSGVIISEIDIHKAEYPSSIWKYAGLDVVLTDGKGRSKKKEHLVKTKYKDAKGEEQEKDSITFNPFLKTKLIGVLASSFLRCASSYSEIYYSYKNRLENMPQHVEKTKGHRHNMAMRYMIKMFLIDLHREWRTLENLPAPVPYHVAKLGLRDHHVTAS